MAENIRDIMTQFLDRIAEEIRAGIPTVTGKTRDSIVVNVEGGGEGIFAHYKGTVEAIHYIYTFEYGRGPTKDRTPHQPTLREAIEAWILAKGFRWTKRTAKGVKEMTPKQMSWAIAIKIHNEGNALYRKLKGGQTGLITNPTDPAKVDAFMKILLDKAGRIMLNSVVKEMAI